MSSPQGKNLATASFDKVKQIEEISHNRRRLLDIASVLNMVNKWHADLHASWHKFSEIERNEGLDIKPLLDAMEVEIYRRGAIERTWLNFFIEWLQFNGRSVSLDANFCVLPDQEGPSPIDFNKTAPLKFSNGTHLDINFENDDIEESKIKTEIVQGNPAEEIHVEQLDVKYPNFFAEDEGDFDSVQDESPHPPAKQDVIPNSKSRFQASRQVLGQPANRSIQALQRAAQAGLDFNNNYQGEIGEHAIRNADCSEAENCSVYIRNIFPEAANWELFDEIHEGPIFQCARQGQNGKYHYHAATLVFMRRESAEAFVNRCSHFGPGLVIRGMRLSVIFNQYKVKPRTDPRELRQSRVLQFTGPQGCLNHDELLEFLSTKLKFNLVKSDQWTKGEKGVVQLEFASIQGQSRLAYNALLEDIRIKINRHEFMVLYAPDPCGP